MLGPIALHALAEKEDLRMAPRASGTGLPWCWRLSCYRGSPGPEGISGGPSRAV